MNSESNEEPNTDKKKKASMKPLIESQDLQIGNQLRFNYAFSNALGYKFFLIDWAYNIFLTTFVGVAVVFIISLFVG